MVVEKRKEKHKKYFQAPTWMYFPSIILQSNVKKAKFLNRLCVRLGGVAT